MFIHLRAQGSVLLQSEWTELEVSRSNDPVVRVFNGRSFLLALEKARDFGLLALKRGSARILAAADWQMD